MNVLSLEGTEDTPTIILDKDKGIMELSGRSQEHESTVRRHAGRIEPRVDVACRSSGLA